MCGLLFEMGSGVKDNTNPIYELAKSNNGYGTTQGMSKRLFWFALFINKKNKFLIKMTNLMIILFWCINYWKIVIIIMSK